MQALRAGDRIYDLCDSKDGLKDGLIDDPRRCDCQALPRPAEMRRKAPMPRNWLHRPRKSGALEKIYGDVVGRWQARSSGAEAGGAANNTAVTRKGHRGWQN